MKSRRFTVPLLALVVPLVGHADEALFIDKDTCPGERCTYCELIVARNAYPVYESPSRQSDQVGTIPTGDAFVTRYGEVHTVPQRLIVTKERGKLHPGDELFILTYTGEGHYRARLNGELVEGVELLNHPWAETPAYWYDCPDDDKNCWGELTGPIQSTWWIYVESEQGLTGWIAYVDSMQPD